MITSATNSRIKEARRLQRRRQRYAMRRVLLEGVRLVGDAWRAQVRPDVVFYVPDAVEANEQAVNLLVELQRSGVETLPCSPAVFAALSETITPQGLAAITPLPELPWPALAMLVLVLDQVRDPGNAGALLRTAAAAGVDAVLFGPGSVDPFNDKVLRAGMGAHYRIPLRTCETWEEVQAQLHAGQPIFVATADGATVYDQVDWRQAAVLVVGGEAAGPSSDAMRTAQPIAVPMQRDVESLNAAVAGAVILFEAARQRRHTS